MHQFVARRSLVADRGGLGVVPGGDDLGLVELCNVRLDVVEVRLVRLEASVDGGQRVLDLRASQEAADHNRFEHRQDSDESDERSVRAPLRRPSHATALSLPISKATPEANHGPEGAGEDRGLCARADFRYNITSDVS